MPNEIPVIDACYLMTLEMARRVEKFPRHQRMTLGTDLTALARSVLDRLFCAKYSRMEERRDLLTGANVTLEVLRFHLRLAADLKALPFAGHEHILRLAQQVGQQVGGWLRSLRSAGAKS